MRLALLVPFLLAAAPFARGQGPQASDTAPANDTPLANDTGLLIRSLALAPEEGEETLALALMQLCSGDCTGALARLDSVAGADDALRRRLATERARLTAWIALRDAYLAELERSGKPLAFELDGKKVSAPIRREQDELVLLRGPVQRVSVGALAPEALVATIPKERFEAGSEWLKIYPYCVAGNPKWKRLTTHEEPTEELKRDALESYPRFAALGQQVLALDTLARIQALLALGRADAWVHTRIQALTQLAARLLAQVSASLEVADLVHAEVGAPEVSASKDRAPAEGTLRLTYDFSSIGQQEDWRRDEDYLDDLRLQLEPVGAPQGDNQAQLFAPGPKGFAGNGRFCWRHVLEFAAPMRVRYKLRWEPIAGGPGKVFAFALGMLGDEDERHLRASELGFLYVDEQDGVYTAVRPQGDATVQLGQTYSMEFVHDGRKAEVWVDGVLRAQAAAPARKQGRLFLWGHSDLRISVPWLEIEGRVAEASLDRLRAEWAATELAALGLGPAR